MHPSRHSARHRGFTLIELLLVVAIVGLLSTLAIIGLNAARTRARTTAAVADMKQFATAISILALDTGKYPNGCPTAPWNGQEAYFSAPQAGLAVAPTVGATGSGCQWTAAEVAKWKGPYATKVNDPWGHGYYFDPDYTPYQNCASKTALTTVAAIVSFGPNGVGPNGYDCDDIYYELQD